METTSRTGTAPDHADWKRRPGPARPPITLIGNDLGNQRLIGNDGNNRFYGLGGNDELNGYGGNDNLDGGAGNDKLTGGAGADNFVFRYSTLATGDVDTIMDFQAGDKIFIDHPTWAGSATAASFRLGANALDADDRFLYDAPNNNLYLDVDGTGSTAKVLIATFANGYALNYTDIEIF
ncbi:hypothetical protein AB4144_24585 [Rhizobiaceae sp. 2RAB30]